ncbi:hypothetical protein [Azospirillum doebereinerae]|uniref:hypothetical protein n=1 Tax=Azospirillum doebereinerae TaxID=92933 RepID=UPI00163C6591|nr:hypothetical protein [Azospirillum doebereinerae]MCG5244249.1 hypothetical protein [Azospirillum doebereinerae]
MISRAEVTSWLALDEAGKSAGLKQFHEEGRLEAFMNRLLAAYPDLQDPAPEQTLWTFSMAPLLVPAGAEIDVRQALSACNKFDQLCHLVTRGAPANATPIGRRWFAYSWGS